MNNTQPMTASTKSKTNTSSRIELCEEFAKRIKLGEFNSSEPEDLGPILELTFLQIREQDIIEHINSIADKVDEIHGDLNNTDPVLLWEEADEDGEDIGGDGNHTRMGLKLAKFADKIKTRRVPKSIWQGLGITTEEMVMIGTILNKENEKVKESNSVGTLIKHLIDYRTQGHEFDSKYCHDALKAFGIDTKKKRDRVIKKAKEYYRKNQATAAGKKVKQYGQNASESNNDELNAKAERLRDSKTMVITGSTGASHSLEYRILSEIIDSEVNQGKHKIVLIAYHNSFENEENWESGEGSTFINRMNTILSKLKSVKVILEDGGIVEYNYQLEIYVMPHLVDDGRQKIKTN